ncbi:MAG: helix-turn-helix domain-containing protein [Elainellaceae cyanobacterium]
MFYSDDIKLKSNIAEYRARKGLTQIELAREVGVTETTIANWEKERRGLECLDRAIRLCRALDCQLEDLVKYVPDFKEEGEKNNDKIKELSFSEMQDLANSTQSKTVHIIQAWPRETSKEVNISLE